MFKTPKYKLITIQSFLTNFCYVFLHLTGYSPTKGLNTDNHGKFPFLSAVGGLFEPANSLLKYNSGFPFERFDLEEDRIFFVSEPNIISVFCNNIFGNNQILLENIQPITETYTKEIIEQFYKGYLLGLDGFVKEIGSSFPFMEIPLQKELLKNFMDDCQTHLYFEGFAIPQLLQNLGYIQACLVTAFNEYQNLNRLTANGPVVEDNLPLIKNKPLQLLALVEENVNSLKILIKYPMVDIITIWMVLLDLPESRSLRLTPDFKTEGDVLHLLGIMFTDISGSNIILPSSPFRFYELPIDYQPILYLLMHATYKLNYNYTRLPLDEYCKALKNTFSVYETIELNHMPGNFTKKQSLAIAAIKELENSVLAKNTLQILAKIPNYRITVSLR